MGNKLELEEIPVKKLTEVPEMSHSAFVYTLSPTFFREFSWGLLEVCGWSLGFSWWRGLLVLTWGTTAFCPALTWKNAPFLRSGWVKKGGISPEVSFVDWGSSEMGTAEVVLWWQVGGCKDYGSLLLAPPSQAWLLGKIHCVYMALCLSALTFGPLSLPTEVSAWHK